MGYRGRPNDSQARKGGLNPTLIPIATPLFGNIINPAYVAPPNNNWIHDDPALELPQNYNQDEEEEEEEEGADSDDEETESDDDGIDGYENVDGNDGDENDDGNDGDEINDSNDGDENAVGDDDSDNDDDGGNDGGDMNVDINEPHVDQVDIVETSTSSSESGDVGTDDESSKDFSPEHYAQLAKVPRVPTKVYDRRQKSHGKKKVKLLRRKSVRGPPPKAVLGKRKLHDETSIYEDDEAPAAK
ncbi:hypothetical protein L1987_65231 [Smallanthus sonchifolius]|uniref:Uncharacterized protein n=1 Tax=Smallanthus sonchifolius TaxID=185202 RepID=A0ACB9BTT9_9ASTR|nr:hypothetical protein L1987_65231 [Smallanthus sonchifolius]